MVTREHFVNNFKTNQLTDLFNEDIVVCYTKEIFDELLKYAKFYKAGLSSYETFNIGAIVAPYVIDFDNPREYRTMNNVANYLKFHYELNHEAKVEAVKKVRNEFYSELGVLDAKIHNILARSENWEMNQEPSLTYKAESKIYDLVDEVYNFQDSTMVVVYEMITVKDPLVKVYYDGDVELTADGKSIGYKIFDLEEGM